MSYRFCGWIAGIDSLESQFLLRGADAPHWPRRCPTYPLEGGVIAEEWANSDLAEQLLRARS